MGKVLDSVLSNTGESTKGPCCEGVDEEDVEQVQLTLRLLVTVSDALNVGLEVQLSVPLTVSPWEPVAICESVGVRVWESEPAWLAVAELDDVDTALGLCDCEGDTGCVRLPLPVRLPVGVMVDVRVSLGLEVGLAVAACEADCELVVSCDAV